MSNTDLCTIQDVYRYVPGYQPTDSTDAQLAASITSESAAIQDETGRLIVPFADQPETRAYPIRNHEHGHRWHRPYGSHHQRVEIDDLASAGDTDIVVERVATDETTTMTISRNAYRPLYGHNRRQPKAAWEPITALELPTQLGAQLLVDGETILVTGNFGFPMIPPFIVEACAKRVILRYASDVASAGTQLSAAIGDINLAGLFASSRDDIARLSNGVYIA